MKNKIMNKRSHLLRTAVTIFFSIFVLGFFIDLALNLFVLIFNESKFFQRIVAPLISFGIAYLMWRNRKGKYGENEIGKDVE
jgi:hypothetical protein